MTDINNALAKAAAKVMDKLASELFGITDSFTATSADTGSDIMAELEQVYDRVKNAESYEVWTSRLLTGENGLKVDCRVVKEIRPVLPFTTHILIIPESLLDTLRPDIVAAGIPVFSGGKRIL